LTRIIRKFEKGDISQEQAKLLLKSSLGLSDDEINVMLSIDNEPMEFSAQEKDELLLAEFASCGVAKSDYVILKTLPAFFTSQEFNEVNQLEANVLDLLRKDKRITPEVIAETLDIEVESAKAIIERLTNEGRINTKIVRVGIDEVIERTLTEPLAKQTDKTPETLNFKIFYSYEGPEDDRNRAFCARLLELDKLWSRAEIETMSRRMGYSVWDRRGGWWTKPSGDHSPSCRHKWVKNIVMRKK
jgi:DNA-binding Lrp family transcriptional regulator